MVNYRKVTAKLKSGSHKLKWSSAATASALMRPLSRDKATWHARQGAAQAHNHDFDEAALNYQQALNSQDPPAEWQFQLGWCLRKAGDLAGAVEALEAACATEKRPAWLINLALALYAHGNMPAAVETVGDIGESPQVDDVATGLELANLYAAIGRWDVAESTLAQLAKSFPKHANVHRRHTSMLRELAGWGGSFVNVSSDRSELKFRFGAGAKESRPARIRAAIETAVELDPRHATWLAPLGDAQYADGDVRKAIKTYDRAMAAADSSTQQWVLTSKHRWQFRLERMRYEIGEPQAEDPLFAASALPQAADPPPGEQQVAGLFDLRVTYLGMGLDGFLATSDADSVEIFINGEKVRSVNTSTDGFFPSFKFQFRRSSVEVMPMEFTLEVRTPDGKALLTRTGSKAYAVSLPHGSETLSQILESGTKIDKKGEVAKSLEDTRERQQEYLRIYDQVRDFFEEKFDRSLFLMYGTLLGYYRGGDFIPTDDDFDAGYVSHKDNPAEVKAEAQDLIVELVKAGYTVSINRRGKLFRIQLERGATDGFHLDLRPLWFQDGRLWVHNHCSYPSTREKFLPVIDGELRGTRVSIPHDTEDFLRNHYGPGWKTPDPGFVYYADEVDPKVRRNLEAAFITPAEFRKLASRVERETAGVKGAGRLVSVGSQSLYPLEDCIS